MYVYVYVYMHMCVARFQTNKIKRAEVRKTMHFLRSGRKIIEEGVLVTIWALMYIVARSSLADKHGFRPCRWYTYYVLVLYRFKK